MIDEFEGGQAPRGDETALYPRLIACALLFAQRYFGIDDAHYGTVVPLAAAHFLLTGQYDAWDQAGRLPESEMLLLGRMLAHRHNLLAVDSEFFEHAPAMLAEGRIAHFGPAGDGLAAPHHGADPLACARVLLEELDALRAGAPSRTVLAPPGMYTAPLRVANKDTASSFTIDARYHLQQHHAAPEPAPVLVRTSASLPEIDLKIDQFQQLAAELDAAQYQTFRGANRLFQNLCTGAGERLAEQLRMRAGAMSVLSAPTGIGKSVMMRGLGAWCVQEGTTLTLVVPNNVAVLELAYGITQDLEALGLPVEGVVAPLMSPDTIMEAREKVTSTSRDAAFVEWVNRRLGYGCGLAGTAELDEEVDAWVPGSEPCRDLVAITTPDSGPDGRRRRPKLPVIHTCPFHHGCGKHRLVREACTAQVIVTTHANFQVGRLRIPVAFDEGPVEENATVEKLVLARSQLVVIDEVDAFQNTALSHAGRELILMWGGRTEGVPLHELDRQVTEAFTRIPGSMDEPTRGHLFSARLASMDYANHLARGRLGPTPARRAKRGTGPARRVDQHPQWIIPNRWDGYLAVMLKAFFRQDPALLVSDPEAHRAEHADTVLLKLLTRRKTPVEELPEHVRPMASALRALTEPSALGGVLEHTRRVLDAELSGWMSDRLRADTVDRLLRRSYLVPLRSILYWFVNNASRLNTAGIPAARQIADALGAYSTWRAAPYGPQGRLMFAFTEHVPDGNPGDTRLAVSGFGGDPHVYTTGLGKITALAHAGASRVVLGLSATAYLPGAHRHHIHTPPTWWVPDLDAGGVTVRAEPIPGLDREMIRISGKTGSQRRDATRLLGRKLGPRLSRELETLAHATDTPGVQDRIALATTSYESCVLLAEGLRQGGVPPEWICVAVPPKAPACIGQPGMWNELPGDRLEDFGRMRGARIVIAPLGRIERTLNILAPAQTRSAIGSIWLAIRPVPLIDDPAELLAHVNAAAHAEARASETPWLELKRRRDVAGHAFEDTVTSQRYMRALPHRVQMAIAAELIITLIQLVGRARRGGTPGVVNLVDYAFLDPRGGSDLPKLIQDLRAEWERTGELPRLRAYYGATLQAFFDFADNHRKDRPC